MPRRLPETAKPHQFKKGEDPKRNTTGLNRGYKWGTVALKHNLQVMLTEKAAGKDVTHQELLIKRMLNKAIAQGSDATIRLMWEALEGKASQPIKIETDELSPEDRKLLDIIKAYDESRDKGNTGTEDKETSE